MSGDKITLKVLERTELGKAVKALRKNGQIPANIYERGQKSQAVSAEGTEIVKVYHQAGKHHPVELDLGGKKRYAMIKDVDVDPVKGVLRHVAFHAVNMNETVEAEVPVHLDGDIPALKQSLMVLNTLDSVMVEALPNDLPDALLIDASILNEVGDKVTVGDIKVPSGVTILTEAEQTVAVVEEPKDQIAAADAALAEEQLEASDVPSEEGGEETDEEEPAAAEEEKTE